MKKLLPLLLLILIGCSEPEPIEFSELVVRDNIHYTFKDDKVYTGEVINFDTYYSTQQGKYLSNKSRGYIENGKFNGPFKIYRDDGILSKEGNYLNGEYEGLITNYNNQNLFSEENYTNGVKNGEFKSYSFDGELRSFEYYINGEKNGEFVEYWEGGTSKIITNYLNDKKEGKFFQYQKNGLLVEESNYKNDKLDGLTKQYNDFGKIEYEFFCNDGYCEKFKVYTYHYSGELKEEYFKKKGKSFLDVKDGSYISYKKNGEMESKGEFKNDEPWEGFLITIDDKGEKKEGNYKNGKRHGRSVTFWSNGNLKYDTESKNGVFHGKFKSYYENGSIKSDSNYVNGEPIDWITYNYESLSGEGTLKLVSHYGGDSNLIKSILYEDGQISVEMNYKDKGYMILDGPYKTYKNGQLIEEEMYKNGKKDGYYKRYWSNGQSELNVYIEGTYKNDKREGSFKEYKPNGSLIKEDVYKDGVFIDSKEY